MKTNEQNPQLILMTGLLFESNLSHEFSLNTLQILKWSAMKKNDIHLSSLMFYNLSTQRLKYFHVG